jgi:hypothetical protein
MILTTSMRLKDDLSNEKSGSVQVREQAMSTKIFGTYTMSTFQPITTRVN